MNEESTMETRHFERGDDLPDWIEVRNGEGWFNADAVAWKGVEGTWYLHPAKELGEGGSVIGIQAVPVGADVTIIGHPQVEIREEPWDITAEDIMEDLSDA